MANNIIQFQAGREAAINGQPRDNRRSADWLEGWDQVNEEKRNDQCGTFEILSP